MIHKTTGHVAILAKHANENNSFVAAQVGVVVKCTELN